GRTASTIVGSLEAAIGEGRLAAGAPLPTVRALALSLAVSPATVAAAYRTARARGLLTTDGRRGTRVSARPPPAAPPPPPTPPHPAPRPPVSPPPAAAPDEGARPSRPLRRTRHPRRPLGDWRPRLRRRWHFRRLPRRRGRGARRHRAGARCTAQPG